MKRAVRFSVIFAIVVVGASLALFSTSVIGSPQDVTQGDMISSNSLMPGTIDSLSLIPMANEEAEDEYAEEEEEYAEEDEEYYEEEEEEDTEAEDEEITDAEAEDQDIEDAESEDADIEEE